MSTPGAPPSTAAALSLTLSIDRGGVSRLMPLLGQGFVIACAAGGSVEEVLDRELGIPPAYLRERVQTVFLNGRPIDDFGSVGVAEGATLALSAAMPGLAGAVLRRGGFYAAMRGHQSDAKSSSGRRHDITVKLFNMVARDLGPALLERGIRLPAGALGKFLERQDEGFWKHFRGGAADGRALDRPGIAGALAACEEVVLKIESTG